MSIFVLVTYLSVGLIYYIKTKNKLGTFLVCLVTPILWLILWHSLNSLYYSGHDIELYYSQTQLGNLYRIFNNCLNIASKLVFNFGFVIISVILWGNNTPLDK